jgi:hypothetical protein
MALGELQIKPDDFWKLTNGELSAIIRGFVVRRDLESANHRNLFTLTANLNRNKGAAAKEPKDLWPLDIDYLDAVSLDERLEYYKNIGKIRDNGKAK